MTQFIPRETIDLANAMLLAGSLGNLTTVGLFIDIASLRDAAQATVPCLYSSDSKIV